MVAASSTDMRFSPKNEISPLSAKAYRNAEEGCAPMSPPRNRDHRRWQACNRPATPGRVSALFAKGSARTAGRWINSDVPTTVGISNVIIDR